MVPVKSRSIFTQDLLGNRRVQLGLFLFFQVGNAVIMGFIIRDWQGWSQASASDKRWLISISLQTVVTVIGLAAGRWGMFYSKNR